jgi:DNA-binding transcriptional LysR family regulator
VRSSNNSYGGLNDIYFFASVVQYGGFSAATVNVIEERFDIAIRAKPVIEDVAGLVAKTLGNSQRVLVVGPAFLDRYGRPEDPTDLPKFDTVASIDDIFDSGARWNLINLDERTAHIELKPRLVSSDLRVRLQAAVHGIGIALLPEQVISVPLKERLVERVHVPAWLRERGI